MQDRGKSRKSGLGYNKQILLLIRKCTRRIIQKLIRTKSILMAMSPLTNGNAALWKTYFLAPIGMR